MFSQKLLLEMVHFPNWNLYDKLGIKKDATEDEIKRAWKKKAVFYHPDRGGDPEEMKKINLAKEILLSKDRSYYDMSLSTGSFSYNFDQKYSDAVNDFENELRGLRKVAMKRSFLNAVFIPAIITIFLLIRDFFGFLMTSKTVRSEKLEKLLHNFIDKHQLNIKKYRVNVYTKNDKFGRCSLAFNSVTGIGVTQKLVDILTDEEMIATLLYQAYMRSMHSSLKNILMNSVFLVLCFFLNLYGEFASYSGFNNILKMPKTPHNFKKREFFALSLLNFIIYKIFKKHSNDARTKKTVSFLKSYGLGPHLESALIKIRKTNRFIINYLLYSFNNYEQSFDKLSMLRKTEISNFIRQVPFIQNKKTTLSSVVGTANKIREFIKK